MLTELRYLTKFELPEATLRHLLDGLQPCSLPSTCEHSSLSSPLSTRADVVLVWGTSPTFNILHVLHASESWEALFAAGYFKIVLMLWAGLVEPDERARFVVANAWDVWPTDTILFQKSLQAAVRSLIRSSNLIERSLTELAILFIVRGIHFQSIPIDSMNKVYVFDRTDKGDQLACACLAKLLVEGFCRVCQRACISARRSSSSELNSDSTASLTTFQSFLTGRMNNMNGVAFCQVRKPYVLCSTTRRFQPTYNQNVVKRTNSWPCMSFVVSRTASCLLQCPSMNMCQRYTDIRTRCSALGSKEMRPCMPNSTPALHIALLPRARQCAFERAAVTCGVGQPSARWMSC